MICGRISVPVVYGCTHVCVWSKYIGTLSVLVCVSESKSVWLQCICVRSVVRCVCVCWVILCLCVVSSETVCVVPVHLRVVRNACVSVPVSEWVWIVYLCAVRIVCTECRYVCAQLFVCCVYVVSVCMCGFRHVCACGSVWIKCCRATQKPNRIFGPSRPRQPECPSKLTPFDHN